MSNKKIVDETMLDPDARFILANERTLLAWVRTALTILAGAVAFIHFSDKSNKVLIIGSLVVIIGALTAVAALKRFNDADKAIRAGKLPLTGKGPVLQISFVVFFAIGILFVELLDF